MKLNVSITVKLLSIVSLINDISSEMIMPLLPLFIVSVGGNALIIGLIAGLTDSLASISKVFFGFLSDKTMKRKKFVVSGYALSATGKISYFLAFSWPFILIARTIDRLGKGIRTSARDALISERTKEKLQGRAFGFHRAFDTLGAIIGVSTAIILFWLLNIKLRLIFFIAGIIAVTALIPLILLKEKRKETTEKLKTGKINKNYKNFLIASSIFYLGNFSYMFFILKVSNLFKNIIDSTLIILLLYLLFNVFYAVFSFPFGILSDKIGRKKVLSLSYLVFGLTCIGFALFNTITAFIGLFILYGLFYALLKGNEKAFISDLSNKNMKATMQGFFQTVTGIILLPASIIAGILWNQINPEATFYFSFILTIIALIVFQLKVKEK